MQKTKQAGLALAAVGALVLSACGGGGGSSDDESVVEVAVLDALTGLNQTLGVETERGTTMAIDEINAAGGFEVDGKTYTLDATVTDLQSDPGIAASTAQKVIADGNKFILGATSSTLAGPIATAVQRAAGQVLMMAPATTLDSFVGQEAPIFRTLPSDVLTAEQYIPVLKEEFPEVSSIASLMPNDPIGDSILEIYGPQFEEVGIETASEATFAADESNFAPIIQRSAADADAFFVGYVDTQVASVIRGSIEAGRSTTFFTRGVLCTQGIENKDDIDALTCIIYTADPLNLGEDQPSADFFKEYEEKFDAKPTSDSAGALYYYDYVYLLVEAMKEAGTVSDIPKIQEALKGLSYDGVLDVGFDDEGLNSSPIKVGIVRDGEYSVVPGKVE